jgi:hypothetical protein
MGQQQFLLIVVGVIIVALMVAVSIAMFNDQASASNRDAISNDLVNYADRAQSYYRKPTMLGGGGSSFMGFVLGGEMKNADGVFQVNTITQNTIDIQGIGIELGYDAINPVKLVVQVTPDSLKVVEVN